MPALRDVATLPGPRGWPLVGNLFQVSRRQVHRNVEAWARHYGPLFRIRLGRGTLLVVTDHEAIGTVLRDRPDGYRRTRLMEKIGLEMNLAPGVFASNGEVWRRQRRMVMAGFDPGHVKAYFPSLVKVTQRLRGRWQRAAQAGRTIDLQPELMRFTVDAISGLAFGVDVNTIESDDEIIQQHLDKIFPMAYRRMFALVPWWRILRSCADRRVERSVAEVNAAIDGFIRQARARIAADPARRERPPNLLEAMIISADAGGGLTDTDVNGNVLTMLLAGEDTTANTLAWMIHLLHRHPAALQRAQQEVRERFSDVEAFTPEALAELDYIEACAQETMRLKPVAPFQVVEAVRDGEIQGVRVPKGTGVWCVMRADSLSDAHFPNAHAFEPERWLHEGGDLSAAKRVSMPFGVGARVCPGRQVAMLEIKMAVGMLLLHFDVVDVSTSDGAEAAERMAFTMMPVGLRMRLRERA